VAGGASDFVLGVAALDASDVGGLIQVALQAVAISLGRGQMSGVDDGRFIG
jgi:hypothetical protein